MSRLILASGSPYRRRLMAAAGYRFEVIPASVEEPLIQDLPAGELAVGLSLLKAHHVARQHPDALVVGSDQVLQMPDGRHGEKTYDPLQAARVLHALQGRVHRLYSAAAVVGQGVEEVVVQVAELRMRRLSQVEMDAYLRTLEWQGCAGGYELEHRGVHLFEEIDGDWFTVLGLPLMALKDVLRGLGVNPLAHGR